MINITLPDGSKKKFKEKISAKQVVLSIGEGLARVTVAAKVNGEIKDLSYIIDKDSDVTFLTFREDEGKEVFWHSSAHILAQAVLRLFPKAKLTIGPPIEDGFYYDIDHKPFTPQDLEKIELEMKKIVKEDLHFKREEVTKKKAKELFKDNEYKLELLEEMNGTISIYSQGEFTDLCKGPHVERTGVIKALKLMKVSGAYWRANQDNKQLQRIYGISFPNKKDLKEYIRILEEAKKRDHRKLMKEQDLVMLHEYAPGSPFFLPKGTAIYNALVDFIRDEYKKRGYDEVITPQLFNKKLWETSGHWEHYKDDMFILKVEGQEHSLKPMNCPSHCLIFNKETRSYKDLPLKIADFCSLHRNELSGTLSGLVRVRKFSQDDAHIFCTEDQIGDQIKEVLEFIKYVWEEVFGFNLTYYLSTRPEKYLGGIDIWNRSEAVLMKALQELNIPYQVKEGDGAFYGPKIDIDIEDALKRKWQCPTVQLDFNLPERFNLLYESKEGTRKRPVMIHRAVLGSLERFFGIMIEHFEGRFPLWLSPVQVKILTIASRHDDFALKIKKDLSKSGVRVEIDSRMETMNKKIRESQLQRVNYILVIGDKELESDGVNVRTRDEEVLGFMKLKEFKNKVLEEIKLKK
ncbi:MAG: threonine--tRNA ligase [Candidatus Woesearchaeota archaeon]